MSAAPPHRPGSLVLHLRNLLAAENNRLLLRQFAQFATIGVFGFVCDSSIVYATAPWIGPYAAGLLSYVIVISINWSLNRAWTYRGHAHDAPHRQWARFFLANIFGFVLNRGTYFLLVATVPACRAHLVLPVAAGAVAGMFVNFFLTRRVVFR